MSNQFYITAGFPPIDNSSDATSNSFYITAGLVPDDVTIDTFPTDWGRRCALVIQSSEVVTTCSGFPILVTEDTLPSEMFDTDGSYPAISGGGDIRFSTDEDGNTQLPCDIENFTTDNDPANGTASIWVNVPTVSSGTNTTIYVWYNNPGESQPGKYDIYGKEAVWDSNYMMVQHMNQDPSGSAPQMLDSTSNNNKGTSVGTMLTEDLVDGQIDKALDFDGSDDFIDLPDDIVTTAIIETNGLTISAWVKADTSGTLRAIAGQKPNPVYLYLSSGGIYISDSDKAQITLFNVEYKHLQGTTTLNTTNKYHIVGTFNATDDQARIYVNGSLENTSIGNSGKFLTGANISNYIASSDGGGGEDYWFNGTIDEVRFSSINRSSGWIETEYNNQNSPTTFIIEGAPETPGAPVVTFIGKINGIPIANIAKINGVLIANIAKVNGV